MAQLLRFCRKNLCAHSRAQPKLNERLQRWDTTAHTTLGAAALQRFDPRIDVLRGPAACARFGLPPLLGAEIEPATRTPAWPQTPVAAHCLSFLSSSMATADLHDPTAWRLKEDGQYEKVC